ncbi:O-methyltransferase [Caloramator australicus]|uniref:tRNA 5-hydroxyuridine methyltransferase n=1 Tax=Caloramator australicus RC3 TaxID=857293 RepID=I7KA71_9CLOT|nr:O-methyltransferase [Caloramator australicus]CCJ34622.1 FIG011945: O-methyltransferase family protein [Caloramator australicus RC3]
MSSIVHDYVEDYIRGLIQQKDEILLELEDYAAKNSVPIIHKEVGQLLKILIKGNDVKNILEVGTAIGYSAILMAKACEDCKITSIERDETMLNKAMENINKANLNNRIKIIFGEAGEVLPNLEGKFDLIFLDAAKGHYIHFLPDCLRLLKDGGMLISDNVLFRGMIATNELVKRRKITIVKRLRRYLDAISNHPNLETVVLPIGDGLAISLKIKEV